MNEKEMYISASMGMAIYPEDGCDIDELMNKADLYMYKEKKSR
nr:diguanylate cyclase [Clostridium grantii]